MCIVYYRSSLHFPTTLPPPPRQTKAELDAMAQQHKQAQAALDSEHKAALEENRQKLREEEKEKGLALAKIEKQKFELTEKLQELDRLQTSSREAKLAKDADIKLVQDQMVELTKQHQAQVRAASAQRQDMHAVFSPS